jgi:DNA-directed RNA polymerase specialized sigma24 family protein
MNSSTGSITQLIPGLRERGPLAIEQLWRRYVSRIEGVARPIVAGLEPGAGDEQDVAQSAFFAFCEAAADGQAPQLENRNELWSLLATIARRKATDRVRHALRERRGGGVKHVVGATDEISDDLPTASQVVSLEEVLQGLFAQLREQSDSRLESIATMRLEGATVEEIARKHGCTTRTIQRKLHILERLWTSLDR